MNITYSPMNACPLKANKYHVKKDPAYGRQEKFKGIRIHAYLTPTGTTLITRGGKDCTRNFPHLALICGSAVLDAELWQLGVEDEVIAGWANSKYLTADTSQVQLQCFDILEFDHKSLISLRLRDRDRVREEVVRKINHPSLLLVSYLTGDPEEDFAEIVARGGEGQMYKNLNSVYTQRDGDNRPANHWYKEKSVDNYDVVVMGYTNAKPGKFEGLIGAIQYGMYVDGSLRYLGNCSGMIDDVREFLTREGQHLVTRVFEICAAGQDATSGALIEPRFIRWREDKRPEECVWMR